VHAVDRRVHQPIRQGQERKQSNEREAALHEIAQLD
jgi:hypothetical protein